MKKMRKVLCMILTVIMIVAVFPVTAMAEENMAMNFVEFQQNEKMADTMSDEIETIASGYCGANGNEKSIKWTLYSTGVLSISGNLSISGKRKMKDYGREEAPWYKYKDIIDYVEVCWINNIGKNTISFLSDSTEIHIYPAFYSEYSKKMLTFKNSITVQEIKELAGKFVEIKNVGFCTNANGEPRLWLDLIIEKVDSNQQEIFLYNTLSYSTDEKNIKISIDGNVRILSNYSLLIRTVPIGSNSEFNLRDMVEEMGLGNAEIIRADIYNGSKLIHYMLIDGEEGKKSLEKITGIEIGSEAGLVGNYKIQFSEVGSNVNTVYYDANGGINAPAPQTKIKGEDLIITYNVPYLKDYMICGWTLEQHAPYENYNDAPRADYRWGDTYTKDEDMTLYALWVRGGVTIVYDANGGTFDWGTLADQMYPKGLPADIYVYPNEREGYMFLGWSTDKDASKPEYRVGEYYYGEEDLYLYAVWREKGEYEPGDINDDGVVDILDAIRLSKYIAKMDVEINYFAADVNGDEAIDIFDLIRLKKYLAKMPVELV